MFTQTYIAIIAIIVSSVMATEERVRNGDDT